MKRLSALLFLCVCFLSSAQAKEVSDVKLADTLTLDNQTLILNGAGERSKMFFDLYVASLYLPNKTHDTANVLSASRAVIKLNITSSMITAEKMKKAIEEGFNTATGGDIGAIQTQIDQFTAVFSDKISEGDQFTFDTSPTAGVTASKNGSVKVTINNDTFRQALLNIWLGDDPVQSSLKNDLLDN
ncbi:chalcone isomerase family protein [Shewanella surugensis]|uniref:Chalcone isomerase family protein n=1 Tax=Shewanella surugensis TaxID=212020 RepID=A0ABT0LC18_9GAMM|nr:chalcone isomerase family protein [Shewanella surugensis]MCL1125055.1 chalcone isomerase family protein [Shewanella surugensis]